MDISATALHNLIAAVSAPARSAADNCNTCATSSDTGQLSPEQQAQVTQLKARDREVRAHEAAHLAAAGGLATGAASFSYQTGPDHRRYAVGGEVSIDTSPVAGDPEATERKAEAVRAAALAPAKPSSQDRAVAAQAAQMAAEARMELLRQQGEEQTAKPAEDAASAYAQTTRDGSENGNSLLDLHI